MKKALFLVLTIVLYVILLTKIGFCYVYVETAKRHLDPGGRGMTVKGDYAYIIQQDQIVVMDISDKYYSSYCGSEDTIIRKVDIIGGGPFCLIIKDNFVYVASHNKLSIIDISDPQNAYVCGALEDERMGNIVSVSQNYLFVCTLDDINASPPFSKTISKYDIRDKHNPAYINSIELPIEDNFHTTAMDIYNDRLYVTATQCLFILDISSLAIVNSYPVKGNLTRIVVENGYAFIGCSINQDILEDQPLFDWPLEKNFGFHLDFGGVLVLDISDDSNVSISQHFHFTDKLHNIVKSPEGLIYLKVGGYDIYCIDPSDPTEITLAVGYILHQEINVDGNFLYTLGQCVAGPGRLICLMFIYKKRPDNDPDFKRKSPFRGLNILKTDITGFGILPEGERFSSSKRFAIIHTDKENSKTTIVEDTEDAVAGEWYHVTAVSDSNELTLYVNGMEKDSSLRTGDHLDFLGDTIFEYLDIGGSWDGTISRICIYNRALSSEEVFSNSTGLITQDDSLILYHDYTLGHTNDLSGNGYNGPDLRDFLDCYTQCPYYIEEGGHIEGLELDGGSDCVTVDQVPPMTSWTISALVRPDCTERQYLPKYDILLPASPTIFYPRWQTRPRYLFNTDVILRWNKVSNAKEYRIYISKGSDFLPYSDTEVVSPYLEYLDTVTEPYYELKGLDYDTTYYYRIGAVNDHGEMEGPSEYLNGYIEKFRTIPYFKEITLNTSIDVTCVTNNKNDYYQFTPDQTGIYQIERKGGYASTCFSLYGPNHFLNPPFYSCSYPCIGKHIIELIEDNTYYMVVNKDSREEEYSFRSNLIVPTGPEMILKDFTVTGPSVMDLKDFGYFKAIVQFTDGTFYDVSDLVDWDVDSDGVYQYDDEPGKIRCNSLAVGKTVTISVALNYKENPYIASAEFFVFNDICRSRYIEVPSMPTMQSWTISAWVKPDEVDLFYKPGMNILSNDRDGWNDDVLFGVTILDYTCSFNEIYKKFSVTHQDSESEVETTSSMQGYARPGVWYHAVAVSDSNELKLYLNGQEIGSTPKNGNDLVFDGSDIFIGCGGRGGVKNWNGIISNIFIYDRALTPEEVFCNYQGTIIQDDSLLLHHDYTLGHADDLSGHGHNGVLVNDPIFINLGAYFGEFKCEAIDDKPELVSLELSGPSTVDENSSADYTAIAYFSDGTIQDVTDLASWSLYGADYRYADMVSSIPGRLNTKYIARDYLLQFTASYTHDGFTKKGLKYITIKYVPLTKLVVSGEEVVNKNSYTGYTDYTATAYFDNGSIEDATDIVTWDVSPRLYSSMDQSVKGRMIINEFPPDWKTTYVVSVKASYPVGHSGEGSMNVTISNIPPIDNIEIIGIDRVYENTHTHYTALAHFEDGSVGDFTTLVSWVVDSPYASIDSQGLLTTQEIASEENVTITATYIIDNNTNSGSFKITIVKYQPTREVGQGYMYSTIQKAIDDSEDGEMIIVHDGTYYENINFNGKKITVCSKHGADSTIIDGSANGSVVRFDHVQGAGAVLDGFTIKNGSAINGGGIYCNSSSSKITNCTISGNTANSGGGIYCCGSSTLTISNCTISNNNAKTTGSGGGILCGSSSLTIANCTINSNKAYYGGGISLSSNSQTTITNCTISNNTGDVGGGGIILYSSSPRITNCIIYSNTANNGSGIFCTGSSSPEIINCTISGNRAVYTGGVIHCYDSSLSVVTNCIIWNNTYSIGWDKFYRIFLDNTPISGTCLITYSDIQGGYEGKGNIDADPLFVDPNLSDYHLKIDSPCINKGTYIDVPYEDIEGHLRPQCPGYDIGAYEFKGDLDCNNGIDIGDILLCVNHFLYDIDYFEPADINGDGKVDLVDILLIVNLFLYG